MLFSALKQATRYDLVQSRALSKSDWAESFLVVFVSTLSHTLCSPLHVFYSNKRRFFNDWWILSIPRRFDKLLWYYSILSNTQTLHSVFRRQHPRLFDARLCHCQAKAQDRALLQKELVVRSSDLSSDSHHGGCLLPGCGGGNLVHFLQSQCANQSQHPRKRHSSKAGGINNTRNNRTRCIAFASLLYHPKRWGYFRRSY